MKKIVAILSALIIVFLLYGCEYNEGIKSKLGIGITSESSKYDNISVKTLGEITGQTKLSELEKVTNGKFELVSIEGEDKHYSLSQGATFFDLPVGECDIWTRDDETIETISFRSIYIGSNKDIFDEMIISLTKANGNPDTSRLGNVSHYEWGSFIYDKEYKWLRIFDGGQCDAQLHYDK